MNRKMILAVALFLALGILQGTAAAGFNPLDNGTVTDPATNLVWLKNANCFGSVTSFNTAWAKAKALATGACGLSDGSAAGDWRLPTSNELVSRYANKTGFSNIQEGGYYWSMTADEKCEFLVVDMKTGKTRNCVDGTYIWPVRAIKK